MYTPFIKCILCFNGNTFAPNFWRWNIYWSIQCENNINSLITYFCMIYYNWTWFLWNGSKAGAIRSVMINGIALEVGTEWYLILHIYLISLTCACKRQNIYSIFSGEKYTHTCYIKKRPCGDKSMVAISYNEMDNNSASWQSDLQVSIYLQYFVCVCFCLFVVMCLLCNCVS